MLFRLGDGEFAVPVEAVEEVAPCGTVEPLPSAPPFLAGAARVRGERVPVVDLARHLAIPSAPTHGSRLLLVRCAGRKVGLIVDQVLGVEPFDPATVAPLPADFVGQARRYLRGAAPFGRRLVLLLEPHDLLSDAERESLAAVDLPSSG